MHSRWFRERDLKVYFEDLNIEPAKEDGQIAQQLLIFPSSLPVYDMAVEYGLRLNREVINIFQRNLNASFGLLRRLAGAKSVSEIISLQAAHFNYQVATLIAQTKELAALSVQTYEQYISERNH